ncbi:hypothetical protein [uncultured Campylobacter sp.]|uniref:hypothetical protein n=1 Tax=uncultured Campylobacter sp. TaxID=218934 RepID=UPI00260817B8|nr:hypothetical protein [uncultured Campylobacter sp.]
MRRRGYGAKFAASERLKFSAVSGFIKLNFINRAGAGTASGDEILQNARAANVRGLNLKFYPAKSRRSLNNPRKFSGKRGEQRKFSAAKFT